MKAYEDLIAVLINREAQKTLGPVEREILRTHRRAAELESVLDGFAKQIESDRNKELKAENKKLRKELEVAES